MYNLSKISYKLWWLCNQTNKPLINRLRVIWILAWASIEIVELWNWNYKPLDRLIKIIVIENLVYSFFKHSLLTVFCPKVLSYVMHAFLKDRFVVFFWLLFIRNIGYVVSYLFIADFVLAFMKFQLRVIFSYKDPLQYSLLSDKKSHIFEFWFLS